MQRKAFTISDRSRPTAHGYQLIAVIKPSDARELIYEFLGLWAYNHYMNWEDRISSDRNIMVGKPTITGTRITVEFILGRLADGWTEKDILENYPRLTPDDLRAVFAFAAERLKDEGALGIPTARR